MQDFQLKKTPENVWRPGSAWTRWAPDPLAAKKGERDRGRGRQGVRERERGRDRGRAGQGVGERGEGKG